MPRYEPGPIEAKTVEELCRVVEAELREIAKSSVTDYVALTVLHRPPDKVFPGMLVYADGTDWDPGMGEGLYVYTSDGDWA